MNKIFDTTKEDVEKMTWNEVDELMSFMIRNDLYKLFCEHIGGPPHVIRHNVELGKMDECNS